MSITPPQPFSQHVPIECPYWHRAHTHTHHHHRQGSWAALRARGCAAAASAQLYGGAVHLRCSSRFPTKIQQGSKKRRAGWVERHSSNERWRKHVATRLMAESEVELKGSEKNVARCSFVTFVKVSGMSPRKIVWRMYASVHHAFRKHFN